MNNGTTFSGHRWFDVGKKPVTEALDPTEVYTRINAAITNDTTGNIVKGVIDFYKSNASRKLEDYVVKGLTGAENIKFSDISKSAPPMLGPIDTKTPDIDTLIKTGQIANALKPYLGSTTPIFHQTRMKSLVHLMLANDVVNSGIAASEFDKFKYSTKTAAEPIRVTEYHLGLVKKYEEIIGKDKFQTIIQFVKRIINEEYESEYGRNLFLSSVPGEGLTGEAELERSIADSVKELPDVDTSASMLWDLWMSLHKEGKGLPVVESYRRIIGEGWLSSLLSKVRKATPINQALPDFYRRVKNTDENMGEQVIQHIIKALRKKPDWGDIVIKFSLKVVDEFTNAGTDVKPEIEKIWNFITTPGTGASPADGHFASFITHEIKAMGKSDPEFRRKFLKTMFFDLEPHDIKTSPSRAALETAIQPLLPAPLHSAAGFRRPEPRDGTLYIQKGAWLDGDQWIYIFPTRDEGIRSEIGEYPQQIWYTDETTGNFEEADPTQAGIINDIIHGSDPATITSSHNPVIGRHVSKHIVVETNASKYLDSM